MITRRRATPLAWVIALTALGAGVPARAGDSYVATEHGGADANGNGTTGAYRATLPDPPYGTDSRGNCVHCHSQHGSLQGVAQAAFRYLLFANTSTSSAANAVCYACHPSGLSPAPVLEDRSYTGRANFEADNPHFGGGDSVYPGTQHAQGACVNCHDPHGRGGPSPYPAMLVERVWYRRESTPAADLGYGLCFTCHDGGPAQNIARSYADDSRSTREGHAITTPGGNWPVGTKLPCSMCHNVHGTSKHWSKLLREDGYLAGATLDSAERACAFCHPREPSPARMIEGVAVRRRQSGHSSDSSCLGCHKDPHKPDPEGGAAVAGTTGQPEWHRVSQPAGVIGSFAWGAAQPAVPADRLRFRVSASQPGEAWVELAPLGRRVPLKPALQGEGLTGSYALSPSDQAERLEARACLRTADGQVHRLKALEPIVLDAGLDFTLSADPGDLPADARSRAMLTAKALNARGEPARGLTVTFLKVEGPGRLLPNRPVTDTEGVATAELTAGLTAEPIVVEARVLSRGETARCTLSQTVSETTEIVLDPPVTLRTARAAEAVTRLEPVRITVNATPSRLPADGFSTASLAARVTDLRGLPIRGARVQFEIVPPLGRVEPSEARTDAQGEAQATYFAGAAPGTVTLRAAVVPAGWWGTTEITLQPGGVARVSITATPGRLPADGISASRIEVLVTDLAGRPMAGIPATVSLAAGQGQVAMRASRTGADGRLTGIYTAGALPGRAVLRATVRSPLPEDSRKGAPLSVADRSPTVRERLSRFARDLLCPRRPDDGSRAPDADSLLETPDAAWGGLDQP